MDTPALDFVSGFNVVHPPPPKMDEDMDEDDDGEEDLHLEMDEVEVPSKSKSDEMEQEHLATLESLRQNQRSDYLKGSMSGSVQATDRLMKELRETSTDQTASKNVRMIILPIYGSKYAFGFLVLHIRATCCSKLQIVLLLKEVLTPFKEALDNFTLK
jgi:hypothetical protein